MAATVKERKKVKAAAFDARPTMAKQRGKTLPEGLTKVTDIGIPRTPVTRIRFFDPSTFLTHAGIGRTLVDLKKSQVVFSQGDQAENIFYIQSGKLKLSVISSNGKEATIALLGAGDFVGEECVATSQPLRMATAAAVTESVVLQIDKQEMVRALHEQHSLSDIFVAYLLSRNIRVQEDLVDQLFNSSEKRLARALLLLAQFGKEGTPETVIPKISQETLAEMVGTTRSRVNFFMNRFRKLGFIEYNGKLLVHRSLLSVVLHD
ncbi:MAG TPA: Crp/Fnr family transcriptional regulator [Candidatus Angelobacter sp.]|nr:Crp/Fnr family transcriptional regulator [Candidatus Angelobacter sp.]